jgi:hypothetical protein
MPDILTEEETVRHFAAATLGLLKTVRASDNSRLLAEIRQLADGLPRMTAARPPEHPRTQPSDESKPLLLDAIQAAKSLSISKGTLFNLTAPRGPIPAVKIGTRVCYTLPDLERAIEALKVKPSPGTSGAS